MSVSEGDVTLIDDFLMSTMTRAAEPVRTDFEHGDNEAPSPFVQQLSRRLERMGSPR